MNENMMDSVKVGFVCVGAVTIPIVAKAFNVLVEYNKELSAILTVTSLAYILWKWYRDIKKDNQQPNATTPKKD